MIAIKVDILIKREGRMGRGWAYCMQWTFKVVKARSSVRGQPGNQTSQAKNGCRPRQMFVGG